MIPHPAFIHQTNGIVVISDGTVEAVFETLEAFQSAEPDYAPAVGVIGVNYERRGSRALHVETVEGGIVRPGEGAADDYEAMIAKAADYAAARALMDHALYGITDVAEAQAVLVEAVKTIAHARLATTDWYLIRQAETGTATPQEVLDARTAIRAAADAHEAAIAALDTIDALFSHDTGADWPSA